MSCSSSLSYLSPFPGSVVTTSQKRKAHQRRLHVRANSLSDEGTRSGNYNVVDANMRVLKKRMEEVRMRERLETSLTSTEECRLQVNGWNYDRCVYIRRKNKDEDQMLYQCIKLVGLMGGASTLAILTGTTALCLVSLIAHLS